MGDICIKEVWHDIEHTMKTDLRGDTVQGRYVKSLYQFGLFLKLFSLISCDF